MTKNFSKSEFDCNDESEMPLDVFYNIVKVANQLQTLRDYIGKPIKINSAYRSEAYNAKIGGAHKIDLKSGKRIETSQHCFGKAADIVIKGMTPMEVYITLELLIEKGEILQGGLGMYNSFVHYDIRGTKARWNNQKNKL